MTHGNDLYGCPVASCHGYAAEHGIASYYDGVSQGDTFADGLNATLTSVWIETRAVGAHIAGNCCGGGGGGVVESVDETRHLFSNLEA